MAQGSSFHAREFVRRLREESVNKDEPFSEWSMPTVVKTEINGKCICGKDIQQLFQIKNNQTKKTLIIGADCAKRWFFAKFSCLQCKQPLGNVVKRLREGHFTCQNCDRQKQFTERAREEYRVALDRKYGNLWFINQLHIHFPFDSKRLLRDHLNDPEFCNFILDLNDDDIDPVLMPGPFRYYKDYIEDLKAYVELNWDIIDQ